MSTANIIIELEEEPIELCKLLKILDLVEGGGQAKMLITNGFISLNDEVCVQKRKKIYGGDILQFDGELFEITLAEGIIPAERSVASPREEEQISEPQQAVNKPTKSKQPTKAKNNKQAQNQKNNQPKAPNNGTGRKPISFG